ncbi:hypothetical protein BGZ58_010880, partial [Dissophora ornata]
MSSKVDRFSSNLYKAVVISSNVTTSTGHQVVQTFESLLKLRYQGPQTPVRQGTKENPQEHLADVNLLAHWLQP